MAHIDNEYHRLAPDAPQTLEQFAPTLQPEPEEKSKTVRRVKTWAMKLVAGIVAAATVFTVAGGKGPSWQSLQDWPGFSATSSDFTYASAVMSKQSAVQFSLGDQIYRLSATGDLCFLWTGSYGMNYADSYGSADIDVGNRESGWVFSLFISNTDDEKKDPSCAYGTITAADGRILYLEARSHLHDDDSFINTVEELQDFLDHFVTHARIDLGDEEGWGKVLICDTMYSDVYQHWCGIHYNYNGSSWHFTINYTYDHDLTPATVVDQQTINGIDWTFYYVLSTSGGNTEMMLWAVPAQEDNVAFGVTQTDMEYVRYNYVRPEPRGGVEDEEDWQPEPITPQEMVSIIAAQLSCYHLVTELTD